MKQIITFLFLVLLIIGAAVALGYTATKYPIVLTGIAAAIGFLARWVIDSIKESKARLHEKKKQVYSNLLKPWIGILTSTIKANQTGGQDSITPETIQQAIEAAFDNILYGSDEVILRYGEFRNMTVGNPVNITPLWYRFGTLLLSMRKDLGHTFSTVDEIDILAMFMNMDEAMRKRNKEIIKAIKKDRIALTGFETNETIQQK